MSVTDEIMQLFETRGGSAYFGENVSQLQHALQAAYLADEASAPPELIAAALLHDIGHLVEGSPENIADQGVDAVHETAGAQWLAKRFGPAITEPIRLHVAAKRYLCFAEPDYYAELSPASRHSLALQGGPYTREQAREFEANPYYRDAIELRRWDDQAKIPDALVPALRKYRNLLESLTVEEAAGSSTSSLP